MSDILTTKSDSDLSSNSSWSVIEESDASRSSSVDQLNLEDDSDIQNNLSESDRNRKDADCTFIRIAENDANTTAESEGEQKGFIYFDECAEDVAKETEADEIPETVKSKKAKNKKRRGKRKADPLSILSIAASVFTITGITLLCMLFPQNIAKESLENVQNSYTEIITADNVSVDDYLNKTIDMFNVVNEADFFTNMEETLKNGDHLFSEEVCLATNDHTNDTLTDFNVFQASAYNLVLPSTIESFAKNNSAFVDKIDKNDSSTYNHIQTKAIRLIKDLRNVLLDPNLQLFICSLVQDICLIRLVNQLNKRQRKNETENTADVAAPCELNFQNLINSTKDKKQKGTKSGPLKRKIEKKMKDSKKPRKNKESGSVDSKSLKTVAKNNTCPKKCPVKFATKPCIPINIELTRNAKENGKSECERRFEELDSKWEVAGQNHRQKIQEIKENFKNEVFFIKETEKELSLRRQRIRLIRDKYVDHLKFDREKYLYQLHKLREERRKIMTELCHQKSNDVDLKDASVGNYAVLLPGSYDFKQKLQILKNRENDHETHVPLTSTAQSSESNTPFPELESNTTNAFIGYQSIPNLPQQIKECGSDKKCLSMINIKRQKYLEKVQNYYEQKSKYLKKKAALNSNSNFKVEGECKKSVNLTEELVEDVLSQMISTISKSNSKSYKSINSSCAETVKKANNSTKNETLQPKPINEVVLNDMYAQDNQEPILINSQQFKLVINKKPRKQDLYDMAFDEYSKKIRRADMLRWNNERKEKIQQQHLMNKQDPQKSYKEKIIFKGPM